MPVLIIVKAYRELSRFGGVILLFVLCLCLCLGAMIIGFLKPVVYSTNICFFPFLCFVFCIATFILMV